MALRDWILDSGRGASAIPARVAIRDTSEARELAGIATLALASGENEAIDKTIDIVTEERIEIDSWLKPCCICGGIEFFGTIFTDIKPVESFWCVTCQEIPSGWITRRRVKSQNRLWRPMGLSVNTPAVEQQPDRHWSPGWPYSCEACDEPTGWKSGDTPCCPSCGAGPDNPALITSTQWGGKTPPHHITSLSHCPPDALASFRIGYSWLNDRLDELLVAGWTRAELFRRGRYRWPIGDWGAAWLSSWSDPEKDASLGTRGEIVFSFKNATGQVQQTAWPKETNPFFKETR